MLFRTSVKVCVQRKKTNHKGWKKKGGQEVSGCSDRMGRLRQLGEQRARRVRKGRQRGEEYEVHGRRRGRKRRGGEML